MKAEVFNTFPSNLDIHFNYCGSEICDPTFSMEKHIRNEYVIHYLLSGSGYYYVNNKEYPIKSGDIFIIYPDTLVSYKTNYYDPFHFCWFAFSGNNAKVICEEIGFKDNYYVQHLHGKYSIKGKIDDCINLINSRTLTNDFAITSILFELFALLSSSHQIDIRTDRNIQEEHVEKAASYIQMNYMLPINVEDVVSFIRLDRTYLSKIFHMYKGKTLTDYITFVRISQAKTLLERTNYSAKEIASYVGFKDECYFSRVFKKTCGTSPLEYRQQVLEIERKERYSD